MLKELSIKNFAIIDDLRIRFSDGLTIFSGETGAGKSIIINAINLLLGGRASAKLIRTGARSAELEALFWFKDSRSVANALQAHGHEASDELLIRRTISANDRHRIYINERLATIGLLNTLTQNLASISGQHAHQGLLKEEQQLLLLDRFGELMPLREKVRRCFHEMLPLIDALDRLTRRQQRQHEHVELLSFQKNEIRQAAVTPGEDKTLEQERSRLKNSESLSLTVHDTIAQLYSCDGAVVERLTELKKNIEKAAGLDSQLTAVSKSLADASFLLEDIVTALRNYFKTIRIDPARLEDVEARMDILQRLKRKYGGSLESVLEHLAAIEEELFTTENVAAEIKNTTRTLEALHERLAALAAELASERKATAKQMATRVEKELASLKMDHTRFSLTFRPIPKDNAASRYLSVGNSGIAETGTERICFMIAPNVGEAPKPLADIASGGELSRVVLALKAILARIASVETVVFDEVDAGIGGGVAEVVGKKLLALAAYHQIICITHLPQIAKFGDHHYRISKHISGGRTRTTIQPLDDNERLTEMARMLGGVKMTRAVLDHASEMLREK